MGFVPLRLPPPLPAAAISHSAGRNCAVLVGGPPTAAPRPDIRLSNSFGRGCSTLLTICAATSASGPSRGKRSPVGRLFSRFSRKYAGTLAIFAERRMGLFYNASSGGTIGDNFILNSRERETESTSYAWPDKKLSKHLKIMCFIHGYVTVSSSAFSAPVIVLPKRFDKPEAFYEDVPYFTLSSLLIFYTMYLANARPRVCILGGGFGGLYTALRLESLVWPDDKRPQVLLVDHSDRFVFKPMLYELLSGEVDAWEIAPFFTDLLKNTSIQFIKDKVKLLHPSDHSNQSIKESRRTLPGGTVHLESGIVIEYDWLVLALGAESKLDLVPGSAEYALPFSTLADAYKVNEKLTDLERKRFGNNDSPISVAIVGCGYSGVELAATISERLRDKGIVQAINTETAICPNAPQGNREAALKVLQSRNVQLFLGYFVSCIKETSNSQNLAKMKGTAEVGNAIAAGDKKFILELQPAQRGLQSQVLEADLVLWTVGSKPIIPQLDSSNYFNGIPLNGRGQAETDETLRVRGHSRIFAIGDSSALRDSSGKILPATAQVAFQEADFAGWNLWAAINDRPLLPFRFQNLGEMMTLGRSDAAITPSFIEGLTLEGPLGHTARKIAYLLRLPTDEHRLKVGVSWLAKSAIDSVSLLQSSIAKAISGA